ncbi:MAG TPA: hypothetical protein VK200_03460, partial [Candidatus Limnocylindrales bacterium]|nr:hypothetical protein [Candidatus Limnocylindrales bacterium]
MLEREEHKRAAAGASGFLAMTRVLLPRWRDGHAFNAVLFNRARNEAGSFHIFDELAQIFYRLAAAFDDSDRLADRHRALAVRIVSPLGVTANADTNVSNTNTACSSLYE